MHEINDEGQNLSREYGGRARETNTNGLKNGSEGEIKKRAHLDTDLKSARPEKRTIVRLVVGLIERRY